jgi:hypothetical protein
MLGFCPASGFIFDFALFLGEVQNARYSKSMAVQSVKIV